MKCKEFSAQLLANPTTSYWLQAAVIRMTNRDPVDAVRDAEALLAFCKAQLAEAQYEQSSSYDAGRGL